MPCAVTLEILDGAGAVVRRYSSADAAPAADANLAIPAYWVRPPRTLSAAPGMHRWVWDMRYSPLAGGRGGYGMQAIVHDTPPDSTSIWAAPGTYTVRLTAGGRSYTQPLTLKMDPRVKTPPAGLQQQFTLSKQLYDDAVAASAALERVRGLRAQVRDRAAQGPAAEALAAFDRKAASLEAGDALAGVAGGAGTLIRSLQAADVAPTTQLAAAAADRHRSAAAVLDRWRALAADLDALNAQLRQAKLPEIKLP